MDTEIVIRTDGRAASSRRTAYDGLIERWNGLSAQRRRQDALFCVRHGHDWQALSDGGRVCARCGHREHGGSG